MGGVMYKLGDVFEGQYPKDVAKFCNDNGYRIERKAESGIVTYTIVEGAEQTEDYNRQILDAVIRDNMTKQVRNAVSMLLCEVAPRMSDEELVKYNAVLNEWVSGISYTTGDVVYYAGKLYRALQDSISKGSYPPDTYTSGWKRIGEPNEEGIYPWSQPLGATDAYALGVKVTHSGKTWQSMIGNNVWEPGVYGWEEAIETTDPEEPEVPSEEYPEWVQPTGAHDAYSIGDKVSYNGKHWMSNVNGNVWIPGEYGWDEVI